MDSHVLQGLGISKRLDSHLDRHSLLAGRSAQRPNLDDNDRNDDSMDDNDPRSFSQRLHHASSLWIVLDGQSMEDPY